MNESYRFQCRTCGEWHEGLPDLAFDAPLPYEQMTPGEQLLARKTADLCVINSDFFVRATLPLRILGSSEEFNFGVWVSLSEKNFRRFVDLFESTAVAGEPSYFGWLSNTFPWYPDTFLLKTNVHLRPFPSRPWVELEPSDHPLSIHQRDGITPETLAEIFAANQHPVA